jgi:signal transduction histidine kinase
VASRSSPKCHPRADDTSSATRIAAGRPRAPGGAQCGAADAGTVSLRTEAALRQTHRLSALATDLLDLSRVDGGVPLRPEPLEVDELAQTVAGEFVARFGAAGRALHVDGRPALALVDPAALARIERICSTTPPATATAR